MNMHAASIKSDRLQRVLIVLRGAGNRGMTTLDIARYAGVCAVNSIISEIRRGGENISCTQESRGRFRYRLIPASSVPPVGDR